MVVSKVSIVYGNNLMFNPFQIFDLPVDFLADEKVLNARCYLKLQKVLHPDNFVSSSALEQRVAMQNLPK